MKTILGQIIEEGLAEDLDRVFHATQRRELLREANKHWQAHVALGLEDFPCEPDEGDE